MLRFVCFGGGSRSGFHPLAWFQKVGWKPLLLAEGAAEALTKMGTPEAAEALWRHYGRTADDDQLWRLHGRELEGLGKIGNEQTLAELLAYLEKAPLMEKLRVRKAADQLSLRLEQK